MRPSGHANIRDKIFNAGILPFDWHVWHFCTLSGCTELYVFSHTTLDQMGLNGHSNVSSIKQRILMCRNGVFWSRRKFMQLLIIILVNVLLDDVYRECCVAELVKDWTALQKCAGLCGAKWAWEGTPGSLVPFPTRLLVKSYVSPRGASFKLQTAVIFRANDERHGKKKSICQLVELSLRLIS